MFTVEAIQGENKGIGETNNATIEVRDKNGNLRADVYVEFYDGKVQLVITDNIQERDSDDPTEVSTLLADATPAA